MKRTALALVAVMLADWLFFNAYAIGVSMPLFALACITMVIAANPIRAGARLRLVAGAGFVLAMAALAESVSWLSALVAGATILFFVRILVVGTLDDWAFQVPRALALPLLGPLQLAREIGFMRAQAQKESIHRRGLSVVTVWLVPILLSLLFLALFVSANPVLDDWLRGIDLRALLAFASPTRAAFWVGFACLVWPLLHLSSGRGAKVECTEAPKPERESAVIPLLGAPSVLRSLILFNILFALQTALDGAYLWAGLALPHGMTYASYAHRGAYPLVITALLAAAFVLVAMRVRRTPVTFRWIKWLLLAFVAQNVLLMASSFYRTWLYVDAYGLTELRLAALIWMALVGIGLLLISIQILGDKRNSWLLNANALVLFATLYLCCFANIPYIVARYNVTHWLERDGMGQMLDIRYLVSLGPQTIPALDALESVTSTASNSGLQASMLRRLRDEARAQLEMQNWRSLTFRGWRLKQYLETHPDGSAQAPAFWPQTLNQVQR